MAGTSRNTGSYNDVLSSRPCHLLSHSTAGKCLQKARSHISIQHLLLCSAGKAEVVVVTGKLGLLIRNRERFYNSHKMFNQIISAVA